MNSNKINEIRGTLDRWYAGETSPDEERVLMEFFATATELPEDLEAERRLFTGMDDVLSEVMDSPVDMPAEYSDRIAAALDAEIAREAHTNRSRASIWRRRILAAGGVAACLLAGWLGFRTLTVPDLPGDTAPRQYAAVRKPTAATTATLAPSVISAAPAEESVAIASASVPASAGKSKPRMARRSAAPVKETTAYVSSGREEVSYWDGDDMYLSPEEEARLLADNYHVIDNEHEANALVSSVFARLEGNVVQESYKMQDISAQYDVEVTKLMN